MVGINIRFYQEIRAGLTRRIRAVRIVWGCLIEIPPILRKGTVYLIRGHMKKFLALFKRSILLLPGSFGTVEHNRRTQNIGLHKYFGVLNAAVYMAFRCKMHDPVDIILCKNLADGLFITDIRLHKRIVFPVLYLFQVLKVARISELVHIDDTDFIIIFAKHILNIIRADKTCSSGN